MNFSILLNRKTGYILAVTETTIWIHRSRYY